MRWIVLALLLANLGSFAWFRMSDRPAATIIAPPAAESRGGARIRLLSEVPADQLPKAKPPAKTEPAPAGQLCTMLGPFEEEYQGEDIVQRLKALQVKGALRDIEMAGQMRYWVYLEPMASRREAFRKLRALQGAGVDSYVIPKGSLANGISFGIFTERERADGLAEELHAKGIDAHTREEPQTYTERWIVLPPGQVDRLAGDFWSQLQSEYPDLDRRQNLCSELGGD
ncbi:hypothetical protein [Microbulbifer sp. SAOS-129_SWC]|uniref:hypothetical protein n=1 Tax=Microbulbifer sp. SAOS-129_SWC TaxID=3145235 RepID=UPI003217E8D3